MAPLPIPYTPTHYIYKLLIAFLEVVVNKLGLSVPSLVQVNGIWCVSKDEVSFHCGDEEPPSLQWLDEL